MLLEIELSITTQVIILIVIPLLIATCSIIGILLIFKKSKVIKEIREGALEEQKADNTEAPSEEK